MISIEFKAIGRPLFQQDDAGLDFQTSAAGALLAVLPDSNPQITALEPGNSQIVFNVDATNAAECNEIARRALSGLLTEPYVLTTVPAAARRGDRPR